ncbi:Rho GTPase activation protein [Umbelopsis sp. PMI_123]|nr:Rho GTPase activation protein [Umbelopsis sp. PMI_123]
MEMPQSKDKEGSNAFRSWWRKVTTANNPQQVPQQRLVFGVPLTESIQYAHAAIAYVDCNVQYVGFVPCIVAKCGSFLKDRGLYTEGIFRMSGSARRIGDLQRIFDTPPDYGSQLDWDGFTVHDAANVLRRFLNYLPEPVIVSNFYQVFRDVIDQPISEQEKVEAYQGLLDQLPQDHQYLLLYLLDLLALFVQNQKATRMDASNLASVFTPGILCSPEHAMNPAHYKTSQRVIQFLIEHHEHFNMPKKAWYILDNTEPTSESTTTTTDSQSNPSPLPQRRGTPLDIYRKQQQELNRLSFTSSTGSIGADERKAKALTRSRTVPSKRARFGSHDPLQVVQLSKGPRSEGTSPKITGQ